MYPAPPAAAAQSRSMASPRRVKNMVPDELLDAKRERQRDEADVLLLQNRLNHLRYRPRARAHSTFAWAHSGCAQAGGAEGATEDCRNKAARARNCYLEIHQIPEDASTGDDDTPRR